MESSHMPDNHFQGNIAGERMSYLNWIAEIEPTAPQPVFSRKDELKRRKAAAEMGLKRLDAQLNKAGQKQPSRPSSAGVPLGLTAAHNIRSSFKLRPPAAHNSPRYTKRHGKVAWQDRKSGKANLTAAATGKSIH